MEIIDLISYIMKNFNLKLLFLIVKVLFIILDLFLLFFLIYIFFKIKKIIPPYNFQKNIKIFRRVPIINKDILKDYFKEVINKLNSDSLILKKIALKELDNLLLDLLNRINVRGENLKDKLINFSQLNNFDISDYFKIEAIKNRIAGYFNNNDISEEDINFIINFYYNFLKRLDLIEKVDDLYK